MSIKRLVASLLTAGVLTGGVLALVGGTANAAGCSTRADTPQKTGDTARGYGGRENCSSSVSKLNIRLVHYQPGWANEVMAQSNKTNKINYMATVYWTRPNAETANGWDWYTAAETSSGQKTESGKVRLWS